MFAIGKMVEGVLGVVFATLTVVIFSAVFLALWPSLLRPNLLDILNDSNFSARYGTGMVTAGLYLIDIVPFLFFAALFALVALVAVVEIGNATGKKLM